MMAADLGLGAAHEWEHVSRATGGDGERWERRVEAAGGYGEQRRRGGSRAKNEDDGRGEEDEAIYIW